MKKFVASVVFLALFAVLAAPAMAQQVQTAAPASEETVTLKKSDLTPEQAQRLEQGKIVAQLGAYKEYAEMGRGIGLAVGESLRSVKDVVVDFSKTDVGRFTLFLVAWKVMAKDVLEMGDQVVGYVFGPILFMVVGSVLIWSYRRQCLPRQVLLKKTKEGKEYAWLLPNGTLIDIGEKRVVEVPARNAWAMWHAGLFVGLTIFCAMIVFW